MAFGSITARLRAHPTLFNRLKIIGSTIGILDLPWEKDWLAEFAQKHRSCVFFVQIGAHDGRTDDHLYPFAKRLHWHGLLVEPVKHLFDRLKENYAGQMGIILENAAIGTSNGTTTFYRLRETDDLLPRWHDQLGSFRKEIILKHRDTIPDIEKYIVSETVTVRTISTLLERHNVKKIDLLLLDTEGHDFEILKTIDFLRYTPDLLIYEEKHLPDIDKLAAVSLLRTNGYKIYRKGGNNVCWRRWHQ